MVAAIRRSLFSRKTKERKPRRCRGFWYAPTLPGLPGPEEKWMVFQKFLDAGMAIAGIDAGESFGSPSGRSNLLRPSMKSFVPEAWSLEKALPAGEEPWRFDAL